MIARVRSSTQAMLLVSIAATLVGTQAIAADDTGPSATPYRPSVSTPAALSAPGWIEIEAGMSYARDSAQRMDTVPITAKLAFTQDWGIRVGSDVWQRLGVGSVRSTGVGDLGVVLKRRFEISETKAFGLEVGATFPTAHGDTGVGKTAWGANAIFSADFGVWHTDLNASLTRLGQRPFGESRLTWLWAAAMSRPIDERWGIVGELSGTMQEGAQHSSQALIAVSFAASRRLVFDVGAARSLRSGPTRWSAFTGLTWTATQLF